ncbi:hypothetical protein SPX_17240 [Sporomusa paucivorans]
MHHPPATARFFIGEYIAGKLHVNETNIYVMEVCQWLKRKNQKKCQ